MDINLSMDYISVDNWLEKPKSIQYKLHTYLKNVYKNLYIFKIFNYEWT